MDCLRLMTVSQSPCVPVATPPGATLTCPSTPTRSTVTEPHVYKYDANGSGIVILRATPDDFYSKNNRERWQHLGQLHDWADDVDENLGEWDEQPVCLADGILDYCYSSRESERYNPPR